MFIDSVTIKEVQRAIALGMVRGVTTNPTLLVKAGQARPKQIEGLLAVCRGLVFVQTVGSTASELVVDGVAIAQMGSPEELGLKIPINQQGLIALAELKKRLPDYRFLGTAVYSSSQGILAGLAGCDYVAIYVKRMLKLGLNPYELIADSASYFKRRGLSCQIMGASFKDEEQVINCIKAGADTVTVNYHVLQSMLENQGAERAIAVFNQDGKDLVKTRKGTQL